MSVIVPRVDKFAYFRTLVTDTRKWRRHSN